MSSFISGFPLVLADCTDPTMITPCSPAHLVPVVLKHFLAKLQKLLREQLEKDEYEVLVCMACTLGSSDATRPFRTVCSYLESSGVQNFLYNPQDGSYSDDSAGLSPI